jgi:hypothetical protein
MGVLLPQEGETMTMTMMTMTMTTMTTMTQTTLRGLMDFSIAMLLKKHGN